MLYSHAVDSATLGLLRKLMRRDAFSRFNLVGGTALSLQIGHRISKDLDLFCDGDFDTTDAISELERIGDLRIITEKKNTLNLAVDGIRVDMITYKYPLIHEIIADEGVRMYSKEDIAATKLSSIASRGAKRDFYDLYFLLNEYSLTTMFEFFTRKFAQTETFHVLKSLTYFDDAEPEPEPDLLIGVDWEQVKDSICRCVRDF